MEVIILPSVLPGKLDLQAVNRQLRSSMAMLDWRNVQAATSAQLHTLLAGLDLVEHNEIPGIATVPNALAEKVSQVLVWGETPFRLGLWVGQRSTPNTTEESEEANK